MAGRPRKSTEDEFYDVFARFPLSEQRLIVRTMDRLVTEREKDEAKKPKKAESVKVEA